MKTVMVALIALLLAASASADTQSAKTQELAARAAYLECRVHLQTDRFDLYAAVPGVPDLNAQKTAVLNDLTQLKTLTHDKAAFKSYLDGQFAPHLDAAKEVVAAAKKRFKDKNLTNISKEERAALKSKLAAVKTAYETCRGSALTGRIDARLAFISAWIENWNAVIATMSSQGYDTGTLEAVVSQARTLALPALQAARDAAPEAKKTALEQARGLHLHLWANFAIARLRLYLAKIGGAPGQTAQITAQLDQAASLAAPGRAFGPGEFATVHTTIKDAARQTKALAASR